jgi:penicillin-binding protein 1A
VHGAAGEAGTRGSVTSGAAPRGPNRARRWPHVVRWVLGTVLVLVLLAVAAFGGLLLATPSVAGARALASAEARSHHSAYPGPPVPARFAAALEATEDHRFNHEPGIDPFAVARVAWARLSGQGDQGGATLYQQLAKLLYTPGQSGAGAEFTQVALAVKLRYSYSGAEILRMYSAVVYFGHGFWGLGAASCGYFGVRPAALSWPEAAVLAGLVQAPSAYDPLANPALARAREQHVVSRLVAVGTLGTRQGAAALRVPMSAMLAHAGQACRAR